MIVIVINLLMCFFSLPVFCLFEMCNHKVEMKAGEKLYINSPYYPAEYPIGSSCRYVIKAPQDYKLKFTCNIKLKTSPTTRCEYESFYFNREGNEILTESEYFCGTGKMERKSFLNQAVFSYVSTPNNKRILTYAIKKVEEDTQKNKNKKSEIKVQKQQQKLTTSTKLSTTFKTPKENQLTKLSETKTTTTISATTAILNNLSSSFTQSYATTASLPSSLILEENVKMNDNVNENKKVSNSFAYVVTLLSNPIGKEAFATTTSNTIKSHAKTTTAKSKSSRPTSVLSCRDFLPVYTRQNVSIAAHKISTKRAGKVVVGQDYTTSQPLKLSTATTNPITPSILVHASQGGGSFSCLVEVIQPPCECGWSTMVKIVGASGVAGINEFPSMAGIMTIKNQKIFCGATIIHHRYLLSAAHCYLTPETNTPQYLTAVVGEHDFSTVLESLYTRQYDLIKIIAHENFQASSVKVRNDIAVLKTRISIEWSRGVGPACLPFYTLNDARATVPYAGQRVETAGWGTTTFGGQQSSLLLKTTLDVISRSNCQNAIGSLPSATFCTHTAGRDTCQYDSGGALYARGERLFAVGIVSYGYACATNKPSVNTRISSYLWWLKNKTPEVNYCTQRKF